MTSETAEAPAAALLHAAGAEIVRLPSPTDLPAVLHALCGRGVMRLMVEGGSRVAASFVGQGLADEIWLLQGPHAIGADGVPALDALPLTAITASQDYRARDSERLGSDIFTVYDHI